MDMNSLDDTMFVLVLIGGVVALIDYVYKLKKGERREAVEDRRRVKVMSVDLTRAKLCINCDRFHEQDNCPKCGSSIGPFMLPALGTIKEGKQEIAILEKQIQYLKVMNALKEIPEVNYEPDRARIVAEREGVSLWKKTLKN